MHSLPDNPELGANTHVVYYTFPDAALLRDRLLVEADIRPDNNNNPGNYYWERKIDQFDPLSIL